MDVRVDIFAVCTDIFTALYVVTISVRTSDHTEFKVFEAFLNATTLASSPPGSNGKASAAQAEPETRLTALQL